MADPKPEAGSACDFVIVGAGLAGVNAAETLRLEGASGRILLLSEEDQPPYQRPPLSKKFLTDAAEPPPVALLEPDSYRELAIELRLSTRVERLHLARRYVMTDSGERIAYKKLLLATGARPVRLNLPGAQLPGVFYLRTLADARAIRGGADQARRAVVVGGSFIGLEVAASLIRRGIAVTLIEREALLPQLKTDIISAFFQRSLSEAGARVLLGDTPVAFLGGSRI